MATQVLPRGQTASFASGMIKKLIVTGLGTPYTIKIGSAPPVSKVAAINQSDVYEIDGEPVSVTNTTQQDGPPNLTLTW